MNPETQRSYDTVADEYVRRIYDELRGKPFDREILKKFVSYVTPGGVICDLGCGPGHVTRFLEDCDATVVGVDFSAKMLDRARELNPHSNFQIADMLDLSSFAETWDGIVAFYSIVNFEPKELPTVFKQMYSALKSGGQLLLAFHIGDRQIHLDEWWNQKVSLDFYFFKPEDVSRGLTEAGFKIESIRDRDPYPEIEAQSKRAYIRCKK